MSVTITYELNIRNFKAWSGARYTLDRIIDEGKCEDLEFILEDLYPNGMSETDLNDLLWFESETVFEWLGIKDEDEEEYEDEDEDEDDMPEGWEPARSALIDRQWYSHVPVSMD